MTRVAFYCQHVLGIGHLVRSTAIIRELCRESSVLLISGGRPVEGFRFPPQVEVANLPALETDADFGALEAPPGSGAVEEVQQARKAMLLELLDRFAPDVFVVELFPFGRKRFGFELIPALERVRSGPAPARVVCSLRDILVTKRDQAAHEERVCRIVNRYFDLVLVHGDPRFQQLRETFARAADLRCPVQYTGYVVERPPDAAAETGVPPEPFILVTIGSGRYRNGHKLLAAVIQAAPRFERRVVIFAGPFIPKEEYLRLQAMARPHPNVTLDRYTPGLLPYLRRADLSVSMGGYNTIMNLLSTGVRAIVFPYTANDDQEQYIRAEKLHALGVIEMIHPDDLEPARLAAVMGAVLEKTPARRDWQMNGAAESARLIRELLRAHARAAEAPRA